MRGTAPTPAAAVRRAAFGTRTSRAATPPPLRLPSAVDVELHRLLRPIDLARGRRGVQVATRCQPPQPPDVSAHGDRPLAVPMASMPPSGEKARPPRRRVPGARRGAAPRARPPRRSRLGGRRGVEQEPAAVGEADGEVGAVGRRRRRRRRRAAGASGQCCEATRSAVSPRSRRSRRRPCSGESRARQAARPVCAAPRRVSLQQER